MARSVTRDDQVFRNLITKLLTPIVNRQKSTISGQKCSHSGHSTDAAGPLDLGWIVTGEELHELDETRVGGRIELWKLKTEEKNFGSSGSRLRLTQILLG